LLNDTFSSLIPNVNYLTLDGKQRLKIVEDIVSIIEGTTSKGFLTSLKLKHYPIFSELLPLFIQAKNESEYLHNLDAVDSMESYK